jgi:hypothetical protein
VKCADALWLPRNPSVQQDFRNTSIMTPICAGR